MGGRRNGISLNNHTRNQKRVVTGNFLSQMIFHPVGLAACLGTTLPPLDIRGGVLVKGKWVDTPRNRCCRGVDQRLYVLFRKWNRNRKKSGQDVGRWVLVARVKMWMRRSGSLPLLKRVTWARDKLQSATKTWIEIPKHLLEKEEKKRLTHTPTLPQLQAHAMN